jgi:uncharacterized membrane protein YebE (DUF533 family)
MNNEEGISESRFHMWRAIFAMAHADGVVTSEETNFLNEYLARLNFSEEQKKTLVEDLEKAQDVGEMFAKITDQSDRSQFFYFGRMLAWCDGDFDEQEKIILDKLRLSHVSRIDIEQISRSVRESAALVAKDIDRRGDSALDFWENVRKFQDKGNKEEGK